MRRRQIYARQYAEQEARDAKARENASPLPAAAAVRPVLTMKPKKDRPNGGADVR